MRSKEKKTRKKKNERIRPPETHHEIHSSPETATNSRRCATKHVPRVSPYSPASIEPAFVEIGLVQLSQTVKRRMLHIHGQTNYIMAPCAHPGTSRVVNKAGVLRTCGKAVCVRRKKMPKKKSTKQSTSPKTHHEIHSSPATATTSRRLATKYVPRVSPYSPASIDPGFMETGLVQPSQSGKTTNGTHTLTQT